MPSVRVKTESTFSKILLTHKNKGHPTVGSLGCVKIKRRESYKLYFQRIDIVMLTVSLSCTPNSTRILLTVAPTSFSIFRCSASSTMSSGKLKFSATPYENTSKYKKSNKIQQNLTKLSKI